MYTQSNLNARKHMCATTEIEKNKSTMKRLPISEILKSRLMVKHQFFYYNVKSSSYYRT